MPKKRLDRVPRDEYYLRIAYDVAGRSTCLRRWIGAVIVNGDVIVSTGYNGNPRGMPHCNEIGCIRDELEISSGERMEICTGVHAEMNALIFAGPTARGGSLYCTIVPCNTCAKMIINAGIKRVVYSEGYPDSMGYEILKHSGVQLDKLELKTRRSETAGAPVPKQLGEGERKPKVVASRDINKAKLSLRKKFQKMSSPPRRSSKAKGV